MFLNEEKAWMSYAPTSAPLQMITFCRKRNSLLLAQTVKNNRVYTVLQKISACSNFCNPQPQYFPPQSLSFVLRTKNTGTKRKITVITWKIHIGNIWQVDIAEYLSSVAVFITNYKYQNANKVIRMSCCITNLL